MALKSLQILLCLTIYNLWFTKLLSFPVGLQKWWWSDKFHYFDHLFFISWVYWGNGVQSVAFLYHLLDHFHLELLKHHLCCSEKLNALNWKKKRTKGKESICSLCLLIMISSQDKHFLLCRNYIIDMLKLNNFPK